MHYKALIVTTGCFASSLLAQNVATPIINEPAFTRYAVSWECASASGWLEDQFWRDKRPDTTYYPRTGLPTQRSTDETVERCMLRSPLGTTAQRDLLGSVQGYLAAGQDAKADAVAAKLISSVASSAPQVRAWVLYQLSNVYLGDAEPKFLKAEQFVKQLDAMGAPAAVERMLAHRDFVKAARFRDSIPLWERELNAALAAHKDITGDTRKEYAYESAGVYLDIADFKGRINDPQSAIEAITTAQTELISLRSGVQRILMGKEKSYLAIGTQAPPVRATRWFNSRSGSSNPESVHPIAGKPALLVFVSHTCGSLCYPGYAILRRIRAKFEAKGLDIVLMARTGGFYRDQLVKPAVEMDSISAYFTNHLQLPVNIAVWQADRGKRDDGRLTVLSDPNAQAYNAGEVYLVDSKGLVRMVTSLSRANEAIIEDVITSLF